MGSSIETLIGKEYEHGFVTDIEADTFPPGLNEDVIRDPTASRFHAEIRREAGGFVLHARGSAGTMVNNRRVASPCMLEEGDQIEIAYTVLRFTKTAPPTEQLGVPRPTPGDGSHRRPTLSGRVTIEGEIVPPPGRNRPGLVIAIVVVIAIGLWLVFR